MPEFDSTIEYRDIEGFPGYKVGNDGSVWSNHIFNRWNKIGPWKQLNPGINKISGHRMLVLHPGRFSIQVHRLVMNAFRGPCPDGLETCHYDDDTSNNHLSNLRYDTHKSNMAEAARNGRMPTKLTEEQAKEILAEFRLKGRIHQVNTGKKYGVSQSAIWSLINRRTWRHIA